MCGPFGDAAADSFCPFVLEIFYLGVTTGTTPTTYDPAVGVSRLQMAAFLSRTVDGTLRRANLRAAANKFWTPQNGASVGVTTVGDTPRLVQFDGSDLWVANESSATVSRVRASDGRLLETWTGAAGASGVLVAFGRVLVTGVSSPGKLYSIDPVQPPGAVTAVASNLGSPLGIAFDGARAWTGNRFSASVSIVTPGPTIPWTVTTVTTGFQSPQGVIFDGANIWVTDNTAGTLLKLDAAGSILMTVTVGGGPFYPVFDGTSIWVPNITSNSVTVVRTSSGAVLQTLTGNGLNNPAGAGFDGERILIANFNGNSVSLWKAADLSALGTFPIGASTQPEGVASNGLNFWVTLTAAHKLARF